MPFFTPGFGIRDGWVLISESLETIFRVKILNFFDADPGSGMEKIPIRDGKNSEPGSGMEKIRIRIRIRNTVCRNDL